MTINADTVYVVDDNQALLEALHQLFTVNGIHCLTYESANAFLEDWTADCRGCVLLDMCMPGTSGIELQVHLKSLGAHLPVIFMTGHRDITAAVQAMKHGAMEVLQKPFVPGDLLGLVRQAIELDKTQFLLWQRRDSFLKRMEGLSHREREVMDCMVSGASNKEIAKTLGLSHRTIEAHRAHIIYKLRVGSLAELVENIVVLRQASLYPGFELSRA